MTALLGGPAAATAKITAIDQAYFGNGQVRVGRYQLTPRTPANDNIASARAFGRLYKLLATDGLRGLETHEQAELASHLMKAPLDEMGCSSHEKSGYLSAMRPDNPAVVSIGGFCRRPGDATTAGVCVYVVNVRVAAATKEHDASARALIEAFKQTLVGGGPRAAKL